MATTAAKPEVFSRKASGLSRVMSPWSAFMYNFLTMGVIFPWTFVWAPAAFPGVSVWEACLLRDPAGAAHRARLRVDGDRHAALRRRLRVPEPRARRRHRVPGRDERVRDLDPAVGRPRRLAARHPRRGAAVHGPRRATTRTRASSTPPSGAQSAQGNVIISIIGAAAMALLLVTGFKNYVRLQYFMFAATGILVVILLVQFLRTTPAEFADGDEPLLQRRRRPRGLLPVDPEGRRRRRRQPAAASSPSAPRCWPCRSCGRACSGPPTACEQGGEIKGARVFKNQMFIIVGSMIAMGVVLAAHRLGRGAGCRHRLLQRRVALLLLRGERLRRRDRQRPALPGHVRHRDLAATRSSSSWWRSASCSRRCRSPATATSA